VELWSDGDARTAPSRDERARAGLLNKPHPDLFLHAVATMECEPARCAVVEDAPSGVTAAVSVGMRALGYTANSDEAALRRASAETLLALDELPAVLGLG
jgi:beta-phosphoglucomutase-like phosphatase (HAD superfamily)